MSVPVTACNAFLMKSRKGGSCGSDKLCCSVRKEERASELKSRLAKEKADKQQPRALSKSNSLYSTLRAKRLRQIFDFLASVISQKFLWQN